MININPEIWKEAQQALDRAVSIYLIDPNVSLIDLGFRIRSSEGNRIEPELTVRIHLHQKLYGDEFKVFAATNPDRVIDTQRIGFAMDVLQATYELDYSCEPLLDPNYRVEFSQELCGGSGISNSKDQRVGTLGGFVRDRLSGEDMILSNWHVLAGSLSGQQCLLIYQTELEYDNSRLNNIAKYTRGALSLGLDAAVARLNEGINFTNKQSDIGTVTGVTIPELGMPVIKSGAGSGVTSGVITGILGYSIQHYDGINCFVGPVVHISLNEPDGKLCASGDSGAWWLEQSTMRAVGLHFAGSEDSRFGLAFPMPDVFRLLNVEIVTEQITDSLTNYSSVTNTEKIVKVVSKQPKTDWTKKLSIFTSEIHDKSKVLIKKTVTLLESIKIKKNLHVPDGNFSYKQMLSKLFNQAIKIQWYIVQICLMFLCCIIILNFNYYQPKINKQQQKQLDDLHRNLLLIKRISQIEWERINSIKKIIIIIDQFNPGMDSPLKIKIANEIYQMTKRHSNLDIELICATITHESAKTWNPEIVSHANAIGLMQIIPSTGSHLAKEDSLEFRRIEDILFDPILNIRLGCRYLSTLIEAYNIDGGLAAYNGGMRRAEIWLRNGRAKGILREETDKYVPSILKIYADYRQM